MLELGTTTMTPTFTHPKRYDVIVIGAGHAGVEAAMGAARLGAHRDHVAVDGKADLALAQEDEAIEEIALLIETMEDDVASFGAQAGDPVVTPVGQPIKPSKPKVTQVSENQALLR